MTGRVVPVVVIEDATKAQELGQALLHGGINCAEVTLRTPAAVAAIRHMATNSDLVVGAGTVLRADQVDAVAAAGARFVVSPGLSPSVVARCQELDIAVLPGVVTATEVMQALDLGLTELKFFPASTSGGSAAVKALGGPFAQVSFIPTGGISPTNAHDYLSLPNVVAVGGSWLTPLSLQQAGDFAAIADLAAAAVDNTTGETR
jgi:2-dehydro-3-deoxyphosphogluconate aldolase/(4S)-4-hydroxy-2-oxoglutarate aldolase